MSEVPNFFVPAATPENQEEVYSGLAKMCGLTPPPLDRRIYSISFKHDGEVWTATVGETMRGIRHTTGKSRGSKIERSFPVSDPAVVLAIFPGSPVMVVTNHRLVGNVGSRWENQFLAGVPSSTTYFSRVR